MAFTAIKNSATLGFDTYGATLGTDVSFTYASDALGSSSATQTLNLNKVGTATSAPVILLATAGSDVIKTMTIAATGANNITFDNTNAATNAWQGMTKLNVTGAGTLKITGTTNTTTNLATVDASASGGLNLDLKTADNSKDVTFTGGTG
jgi:hypothetical protein